MRDELTPQEVEDGILKMSERLVDEGYRTKDEIIEAIEGYFDEKQTEEERKKHKRIGEVQQ